jgi:ornithine carbamoyltransferase
MALNLHGRNFLTLKDFSRREIEFLLDLSADLKAKKRAGTRCHLMEGRNVALIFEKASTRTRCAFTVAAIDEGAHPEYLSKNDIHLGAKEDTKDTARVLGRMFDGIQFRGFKHSTVEELARYAGVPVWNGLTTQFHPTQMLADIMTLEECFPHGIKGLKFVFMGDAQNNVANSLAVVCSKLGLHFVACGPKEQMPNSDLIKTCRDICKETGGSVTLEEDPQKACKGAHAIYTDVWVSMGEPYDLWEKRIKLLTPYRVTSSLMALADKDAIFLHCLPAFHDTNTTTGADIAEKFGITEMEVTDEVFESKQSRVFDEAENRMHTIKAVIYATLK